MALSGFERRLEKFVEGAFSKAFRSGLQPIEVGRRIAREMNSGRTIGLRGPVVPNHFLVLLSREDTARFESFAKALAQELKVAACDHASDEQYHFLGPVTVELAEDLKKRKGNFEVVATIEESKLPPAAQFRLPDGTRVAVGELITIGRTPECDITLTDQKTSRVHAEVRFVPGGHLLVDLASTNGTLVNSTLVKEHLLVDGDTITIGNANLYYEVDR